MWVGAAAAVGGAYMSSQGAKSAANTQAGAANAATQSQRDMFDKTVSLNSPFQQAGAGATGKLSGLLGIGTPQQIGPDGRPIDPVTQAYHDLLGRDPEAGGMANWQGHLANGESIDQVRAEIAASPEALGPHGTWTAPAGTTSDPTFGSLTKPFSMSDFQLDPGIQFQMQQGNQALTNSAAAKNGVLSGGALKDFIGYNQSMAGTGYQSAYDRYMSGKQFTLSSLMGVSGLGQNAASNTGNNSATVSNGIAGTITGAGNAQAAGQVGSANAFTSGINGVGGSYTLSRLLNNGNPNADLGGPITTSANPGGVYTAAA